MADVEWDILYCLRDWNHMLSQGMSNACLIHYVRVLTGKIGDDGSGAVN
jgi:hypothetical protein